MPVFRFHQGDKYVNVPGVTEASTKRMPGVSARERTDQGSISTQP